MYLLDALLLWRKHNAFGSESGPESKPGSGFGSSVLVVVVQATWLLPAFGSTSSHSSLGDADTTKIPKILNEFFDSSSIFAKNVCRKNAN